jgi:hypothetical protein
MFNVLFSLLPYFFTSLLLRVLVPSWLLSPSVLPENLRICVEKRARNQGWLFRKSLSDMDINFFIFSKRAGKNLRI